MDPLISVIMPTYGQAAFLPTAVESLLRQTESRWELLIVDDASPDTTPATVAPYLRDERIRYIRRSANEGLGAALNVGLDETSGPYVAYLPSDDVMHREHLASLVSVLDARPSVVLAYAGVRHHYNRRTLDTVDGWFQLVQVMHARVGDRWVERREFVTDDLDRMYWHRVRRHGDARPTGRVTCDWVDHPGQLTKLLREPVGGINPYRARFGVRHPLRFESSVGDPIDEVARYGAMRARPATRAAPDGLRILLVGELAYNSERVLALEERGHRLWGLWTPEGHWYSSVGPLPFGHVAELPARDWRAAVRRLRPDLIYGLLNWQAVPFAAAVRRAVPEVPFVWHFKEGPFICRERGTWDDLVELTTLTDGVIHSSREMADWFAMFMPEATDPERSLVLDGDLPKADWFEGVPASRRLSLDDGELHTVVTGRPIGLHPQNVAALAAQGIHLHFYGQFTQDQWRTWIRNTQSMAPRHLHLHPTIGQERWVEVLSRYDAGWLHVFRSGNGGDLAAADWDDLNLPARMATLAAAGLPMIQRDNAGSVVAIQTVAREQGIGLFFEDAEDLAARLRDEVGMARLRANVARHRPAFTFDAHADRLIEFFRHVVGSRRSQPRRSLDAIGSSAWPPAGRPAEPARPGA